jgi:hypothetical protein
MAKWALLALAAAVAHAAVIRGVVVEHQTGKPLARSIVICAPVAGTPGTVQSSRTNNSGAFEFAPLPGGAYLISATRRGFAPVQYGQKQFQGAGIPIILDEAGATFLNIRLPRFGSITGVVVDENDVGLLEHDVVAYRNTRPPQIAGRGRTDDRGVYRIWGLEPGTYLIRTLAKQHDDESYVPTFSRETSRVGDARVYEVALDQQTPDAHVRPIPGRLMTVGGRVAPMFGSAVTVTLTCDAGVETTVSDNSGEFQFKSVAPGSYELFAQAAADRRYRGGTMAAYQSIAVDHDRTDYRLNLAALPEVQVQLEDTKGQPVDARNVQVLARRKDLSGEQPAANLRLGPTGVQLLPGRWDLMLARTPGYYVASFTGPGVDPSDHTRTDGWNEILLSSGQSVVKFVLSAGPAAIHGVVTANNTPVAGAPVFLEAYDLESRRRLTDLRISRTDLKGQYQFYGLAPGHYRVLSSFEYQNPDSASLDAANARVVKTEESRDLAQDLELFVIR